MYMPVEIRRGISRGTLATGTLAKETLATRTLATGTLGMHGKQNTEHFSHGKSTKVLTGALADPDSRLRPVGHINADILLVEVQFNTFLGISRLFPRWRGPKSMAKLYGGPWPDFLPHRIRH